jgi:hypothetical protein
MIVDHDGLFRFIDGGYPGSYHDVTILKHLWVEENWRDLFKNVEGIVNICSVIQGILTWTNLSCKDSAR